MEKLKDCLCGKKQDIQVVITPDGKYMYKICCEKCNMETKEHRKVSEAKQEWNNRLV